MTDRRTLGEVSHTNPYTGEAFGETQTYGRGRVVAADGGEAGEDETEAEAAERDTTLKGVDHTRDGAPSANAAYDRDDSANAENAEAEAE
jgi:hypothetical protein